MDCDRFHSLYPTFTSFPIPKEVWDTPEGDAWHEHRLNCQACAEWYLAQEVARRHVLLADYPCVHMAYYASWKCDDHPDPTECTQSVVLRNDKFDEFFISPRGSTGDEVIITHCPWCGLKLPPSQRNRWFNELESMGIDPWNDDVPERYKTDAWYKGN
jgi:hypothetical protein